MTNSNFDLIPYLEERRTLINLHLDAALPPSHSLSSNLTTAMRYSLLAPGKRLRPILCLAAAEAVGGKIEDALPAAIAVEMMHAASLIHDDLPAMDNDDERRGIATNHKMFGEAMAILAGDALMIEAFQVLAKVAAADLSRVLKVIDLLASATGKNGMIAGQSVDINLPVDVDAKVLDYVNNHKTGDLLEFAIVSGAILGGGNATEISKLAEFGRNIGLAFQLIDDILDVENEKNKVTYPQLLGIAKTKEIAQRSIEHAKLALGLFLGRALPLSAMADYFFSRDS